MYREAKGGAWIEGKVGNRSGARRRRTGSFARMRKGAPQNKKPMWMIPMGPGDYGATGGATGRQPHIQTPLLGTLQSGGSDGAQAGYLFALTPERFERDGNEPSGIPGMLGNGGDEFDRLRIAGMDGKLLWTPVAPVYDLPTGQPPEASLLTGVINWWWMKVVAQEYDESFDPQYAWGYPWASFSFSDAANLEAPNKPLLTALTSQDAARKDWRYRAKLMGKGSKPWALTYAPYWNTDTQAQVNTFNSRSIEIPLPRKLVCDVGKGEALAMMYWIRDNTRANTVGGAPASVFDYSSMRVKCYELD